MKALTGRCRAPGVRGGRHPDAHGEAAVGIQRPCSGGIGGCLHVCALCRRRVACLESDAGSTHSWDFGAAGHSKLRAFVFINIPASFLIFFVCGGFLERRVLGRSVVGGLGVAQTLPCMSAPCMAGVSPALCVADIESDVGATQVLGAGSSRQSGVAKTLSCMSAPSALSA